MCSVHPAKDMFGTALHVHASSQFDSTGKVHNEMLELAAWTSWHQDEFKHLNCCVFASKCICFPVH